MHLLKAKTKISNKNLKMSNKIQSFKVYVTEKATLEIGHGGGA